MYRTEENLHGTYYDYDVTSGGETRRTADPYAKACGTNGRRSMAVELERTDPEGWKADRAPERQREDIIYELHVKEFSWDESAGFPEELRERTGRLRRRIPRCQETAFIRPVSGI